jgi:hypothetical protein
MAGNAVARKKRFIENVTFEGTRIMFRNFAGNEGRYNAKGDRNFVIFLTTEQADALAADGWNVRELPMREDDTESQKYLPVAVKYFENGKPPTVVVITSRGRNDLDEDQIDMLDWVEIDNVDLIVRPYQWDVNGKQGVKAYLKSIYVTIREDKLEIKYDGLIDSSLNTIIVHEDRSQDEPDTYMIER